MAQGLTVERVDLIFLFLDKFFFVKDFNLGKTFEKSIPGNMSLMHKKKWISCFNKNKYSIANTERNMIAKWDSYAKSLNMIILRCINNMRVDIANAIIGNYPQYNTFTSNLRNMISAITNMKSLFSQVEKVSVNQSNKGYKESVLNNIRKNWPLRKLYVKRALELYDILKTCEQLKEKLKANLLFYIFKYFETSDFISQLRLVIGNNVSTKNQIIRNGFINRLEITPFINNTLIAKDVDGVILVKKNKRMTLRFVLSHENTLCYNIGISFRSVGVIDKKLGVPICVRNGAKGIFEVERSEYSDTRNERQFTIKVCGTKKNTLKAITENNILNPTPIKMRDKIFVCMFDVKGLMLIGKYPIEIVDNILFRFNWETSQKDVYRSHCVTVFK